jgi:3-oxoadipate enol-lactonase/4-carboxymuconolactone decarboxylase
MPFITGNQKRIFYRLEGKDGLPVIVMSHSIGTDHAMWTPQVPDLTQYFQVLRFDTRGHGASESPDGEYTVEHLGQDVLAMVDALNISKFAFCGLSMGGALGQWLALHSPGRMTGLILANTAPRFGTPEHWNSRIQAVREGGMKAILETALGRFFSPQFVARSTSDVANIQSVLLGTSAIGYTGCCAALRDFDSRADLDKIQIPTLVIVGEKDVSTPLAGNGDILVQRIAGAKLVRLPAAHLSNLEAPRSFTAEILAFLQSITRSPRDPVEAGLEVRRKVLGEKYVDRAIASKTAFTEDFQELITEYGWGSVWTRPGLDHRTRRLLVLDILAALGRWEEFRLHVSAGLEHDLEICDIKESLLQAAIYAGLPAANTAFHIAQEEIDRLRK